MACAPGRCDNSTPGNDSRACCGAGLKRCLGTYGVLRCLRIVVVSISNDGCVFFLLACFTLLKKKQSRVCALFSFGWMDGLQWVSLFGRSKSSEDRPIPNCGFACGFKRPIFIKRLPFGIGHGNVVYGRRSFNGKPLMPGAVLIHLIVAAWRAILRTIIEPGAAAILMQHFKKTVGLLGG